MGFFFRKSFGAGPFRINFSKSGISTSFGVKGARVNVGPKGTYVTIGANGIYYRKKIGQQQHHPTHHQQVTPPTEIVYNGVHTITSANIDTLTDVDSKDFINELNTKANKASFVNWFGIFPLVTFFLFLFLASCENEQKEIAPQSVDTVAKINSYVGLNVRRRPNAKAKVIRFATDGETFKLVDSINAKWLKVKFGDTIGYVSKRLANVQYVTNQSVVSNELKISNPYFWYQFVIGMIGFTLLINYLKKVDKRRLELAIFYDMEGEMKEIYAKFGAYFAELPKSHRKWQYLHARGNVDYKRNAGAGKLINRVSVGRISNNFMPAKYFRTNVAIPNIKLKNTDLYFLPQRLLIKRGNQFGAVFYKNLNIVSRTTQFIEDEVRQQIHRL